MWMHGGILTQLQQACCWLLTLFPKVFASGVLTWAQYGVVVELYRQYGATTRFFLLVSLVLVLYLLSIYTYFQVIRVGAGSPLDYAELRKDPRLGLNGGSAYQENMNNEGNKQKLGNEGLEIAPETPLMAENDRLRLPPLEYLVSHLFRNNEPAFRWCNTCQVWKPDRCHHCSTCRRCFLRMDHHCPWFACCIGHHNHKYFVQFLVYVTVFSGMVFAVATLLLYVFFAEAQFEKDQYLLLNLVFLFVVSLAFFFAVGCFTCFLVYLVLKNYTTIEFQDDKWNRLDAAYEYDANGNKQRLGHLYDLGYSRNWTSVMGPSWIYWLLPLSVIETNSVYSLKNGLNFEVLEEVFQKYCYNARLQDQLNSQLAEYRDRVRGTNRTTT